MTNDPNSTRFPSTHSDRRSEPGMRQPGQGLADQASETAGQVADAARNAAHSVADMASEEASARFDQQKGRAAQGLGSVAHALRKAGEELHNEDQQVAPRYFNMAADQIESLSGYLESTDLGQVVDGIEDFARRRPMVFAGGAFALGMLAVRFLNSTSHKRSAMRADMRRLGGPRTPAQPRHEMPGTGMTPGATAGISGTRPTSGTMPPRPASTQPPMQQPGAPQPGAPRHTASPQPHQPQPAPPQPAAPQPAPPQPPMSGAPHQPTTTASPRPGSTEDTLPGGSRPFGPGEKI